jgi:hypothetical protein
MPQDAAIGVLLCVLAIVAVVGTLIGAVFLYAAVALYNKLAGGASSPDSVPQPTLGKAMWIILAILLAQVIVGSLLGLCMDVGPTAPRARGLGVDGIAELISFPVSFLIMVGVLSAKLPTTFGRAIVVTLCYMLIVLLVVGVLVGIAVLAFGVALGGA